MKTQGSGEPVVLVHGLWLSGWAMGYLARRLRAAGFRPYRFSYPSVRGSLRANAAALRHFSDTIAGSKIHFVGHSLGGVVIQTMMAYCPPPRPGRIVTICSPHRGSRAAETLSHRRLGRCLLGASMADLLRGESPPAPSRTREIGLIMGNLPIGAGRLFRGLERPNDGVVSLSEMQWPGARDQVVLHVMHSGMLVSRAAAAAAAQFLRKGHF